MNCDFCNTSVSDEDIDKVINCRNCMMSICPICVSMYNTDVCLSCKHPFHSIDSNDKEQEEEYNEDEYNQRINSLLDKTDNTDKAEYLIKQLNHCNEERKKYIECNMTSLKSYFNDRCHAIIEALKEYESSISEQDIEWILHVKDNLEPVSDYEIIKRESTEEEQETKVIDNYFDYKKSLRKDNVAQDVAQVSGYTEKVGLANRGNTCFLNSAMQFIFHSETLTTYLILALQNEDAYKDKCVIDLDTIIFLHNKYLQLNTDLSMGEQCDAQEFYRFLLDYMNEQLHLLNKEKCKVDCLSEYDSIFNLNLKTKVKCKQNHESVSSSFTPMMIVNPMPGHKDLITLVSSTLRETVEYGCETCNKDKLEKVKENATKHTFIANCPYYIYFYLQRYFVDNQTFMEIPTVFTYGGYDYKLCGFIQHIGTVELGGHYKTYMRDEDGWHCYNDSYVYAVSRKHIDDILYIKGSGLTFISFLWYRNQGYSKDSDSEDEYEAIEA